MKKLKLAAGMLALTMLLTACGGGSKKPVQSDSEIDLSSYPIETDVQLTYFCDLPVNISSSVENYGDTAYAQELEKRTGVHIEYIHPAAGQMTEKLNLMISSGELPDIIENNWDTYHGGPIKAINEKIILPIDAYKEYAPAFFGILEANPDYDRFAKTDDGQHFGFVTINDGPRMRLAVGPAVRVDLLKKYGLEIPETIADWENMLTVFKNNGMSAPFSFAYANVCYLFNMFGASFDDYVKGDKVVYGAAQPEFKEALRILNDWFNKGLLDNNIVSVDASMANSQILNDQTGATITSGGGGIGQLMKAGVAQNPDFDLSGVAYPSFEKGKSNITLPLSNPIEGGVGAISVKCKNPALAAKVLDYAYTEEGHILANFGVEGVSYTMENGVPTYTDLIQNNPDGLTVSQALGLNVKAGNGKVFVQDQGYMDQYYSLPQQQMALDNWLKGVPEMNDSYMRVPVLAPSTEESEEYAQALTEMNKLRGQMIVKFITGIEPLENFDQYVETLKVYGMDRAMEIQTNALARFYAR